MPYSNEELLRKATFDTTDFGGAGEAPLAVEQVLPFIEKMTAGQAMLPEVRVVTHRAPKWQESVIDFTGRIAKPGTQGTRLADADRAAPATGIVEMNTVLVKAEVPVTDEVFEDNVAGDALVTSIEDLIADRFGFDMEELYLNGDTGSGDAFLALLNGWLVLAQGATGNVVDASAIGQDYQEIFKRLLVALPDRFRRNLEVDGRFWVPKRLETQYRDILAARGTPLGDLMLTGSSELRYQGILIKGVPAMAITAGTPDRSFILLGHRLNLYAGFQRRMRFETFRDPREGQMSFIVTARGDAEIALVDATAIATNVDVEP